MTSSRGQATHLQQLSWVEGACSQENHQCTEVSSAEATLQLEGRSIGSALLDMNFHQLISEWLDKIRTHLRENPDMIAGQMMQGKFDRMECSFGTAAACTISTIPLAVPRVLPGYNFAKCKYQELENHYCEVCGPKLVTQSVDNVVDDQSATSEEGSSMSRSIACLP